MRTETRSDYQTRLEAAIQFVLGKLDTPPSPVEIADHAGFSRYHFGRVFSMALGEPLGEFVRRLRLERAAWQLENSEISVTEIGFDAGYETLEGFSRAFRDWFRMAPTEYRQRPARHEIQCPSEVHWSPNGSRSVPLLVLDSEIKMEARIEHVDELNVAALRHSGPYHLIGEKFQKIADWAYKHQLPFREAIAIFRDNNDIVPAHELRSDACVVVSADQVLPDTDGMDIRLDKVQPGDYAVATFYGPYEGLGDAWARFCGQVLPTLGREVADAPSFEMYMNDCSTVKPEEIRTDLYVLLK